MSNLAPGHPDTISSATPLRRTFAPFRPRGGQRPCAAMNPCAPCMVRRTTLSALAEKVAARDQQVKAGAIDALADKWQWGGWSDALPLGELGITRAINTADAVTAWMRARAQHVRAEQSRA